MSLYVRMERETTYEFIDTNDSSPFSQVEYGDEELSCEVLASICLEYTESTGIEISEVKVSVRFVPIYSNTEDHW